MNQPLGPPLQKPDDPQDPEWVPVRPGIERNTKTGTLRTNIPLPPILWPFPTSKP